MLPLRASQSTLGRFASGAPLLQRVNLIGRVVTDSHSTAPLPIRSRPIASNGILCQGFATKAPASKPKAHTGRATTSTKTTATKRASKSAPKKKKVARKSVKKVVKRARRPRAKKVLSEEDKQKLRLRELKVKALRVPHGLPATAWSVIVTEVTRTTSAVLGGGTKEASVKYKNLLPEERERYNHIANENKAKNEAVYKSWVESFTPDQIRVANNARRQLRSLTSRGRRWSPIHDDRQVKRPATARILFSKDRWASGDFKGMKVTDVPPLLAREWNALSAQEKKVYEDRYAESRAVYTAERERVYGITDKSTRQPRTPKDSVAAATQVRREAAAAAA